MNRYIFLFIAFIPLMINAQSTTPDSPVKRQILETAIFPGCENVGPASMITEHNQCTQSKLKEMLDKKLSFFLNVIDDFNTDFATCRIQFVINNKGKIEDIKIPEIETPNYINKLLGNASLEAFNQIKNEIPLIEPAKVENGEPVKILMVLPVIYKVESDKKLTPNKKFNYSETVLLTLKSDNEIYEVRSVEKSGTYKVYKVSKKSKFISEFEDLTELINTEPYKSIYLNDGKKHLVTEKKHEGSLQRVYLHDDNPGRIYIYTVTGKTEKLLGSYDAPIFSWMSQMTWLLR